jgi:hypothetical protein
MIMGKVSRKAVLGAGNNIQVAPKKAYIIGMVTEANENYVTSWQNGNLERLKLKNQ